MKKLISTLAALVTTCVAAMSLVANAAPIDPSGNDGLTGADSLYVQQFLTGMFPSYNLNSVDVDQNGIVSKMDSDKILWRIMGMYTKIPDVPNNYDTTTLTDIESRVYRKHKYSSTSSNSYASYQISKSTLQQSAPNSDCMPMCIVGDNNMIRDTDTAVVRLSVGGTGFIVGEHVIATAAHCVYNGAFIDNTIEIIDENNNVIDSFHAESVHVPSRYFTTSDLVMQQYDYALLYVPSVDLSEYGMFSLGVAKDVFIQNSEKQVVVSGFPQKYPDGYGSGKWGLRFKAVGNMYPLSSNHPYFSTKRIYYNADTAGGDSGGPVYVEEGFMSADNTWHDYKTVIGINTHESNVYHFNLGVKITPELLAFYNHNQKLS